jgi:hypothetical protein
MIAKKKMSASCAIAFAMSCPARLETEDGSFGPVLLMFGDRNGCVPNNCQIIGDDELLKAAWVAKRPIVTVFGTKVRVDVTGMCIESGALIVTSAPIFRALAVLANCSTRLPRKKGGCPKRA